MAGSDPEKLMLKANKLTKLSLTRWSADWSAATTLYEQAANKFRTAGDKVKAKLALEKASKGHEMLSSPWDAAKHMDSCGTLAKELGSWSEVADYYRRASELYTECGRSQPGADSLARGARALEDSSPDEAIRMYVDACAILEEDEKDQMAFDLYRAATSVYLKLERYNDAATFILRWGLAADKCGAINSQCMAYLSAVIVYLYAHEVKQAEKCCNDCSQIEAFVNSDQYCCARKLLSAYAEGNIEEIKKLSHASPISNLDHMIIRLARKLPTRDVTAVNTMEEDDEDDLT